MMVKRNISSRIKVKEPKALKVCTYLGAANAVFIFLLQTRTGIVGKIVSCKTCNTDMKRKVTEKKNNERLETDVLKAKNKSWLVSE